ncbi:major facilitator superfamily MFS_1 [Leptospirillum ferriphilum]|uniref:Major facilitator superfamily MFS_1 n=2 Tax=Leptospirillum ferriphilum TaxID=178606 RepID=A0A094W8Y4_9BACT|nr:major facilitator superfamily MFS_1 [Leptospirillum ferriphilum]
MGIGMAFFYPTLVAEVADISTPAWRGRALGTYRYWRDTGYAVGAVLPGTSHPMETGDGDRLLDAGGPWPVWALGGDRLGGDPSRIESGRRIGVRRMNKHSLRTGKEKFSSPLCLFLSFMVTY